jgi:hypothetical protein
MIARHGRPITHKCGRPQNTISYRREFTCNTRRGPASPVGARAHGTAVGSAFAALLCCRSCAQPGGFCRYTRSLCAHDGRRSVGPPKQFITACPREITRVARDICHRHTCLRSAILTTCGCVCACACACAFHKVTEPEASVVDVEEVMAVVRAIKFRGKFVSSRSW